MSTGQFNPDTLEIVATTPYAQAHEWAHLEQQATQSWAWKLRERTLGEPFIERLAHLALEVDAALTARREMKACGIWRPEDAKEAWNGILFYVEHLLSDSAIKCLPKSRRS